MNFAPTTAQVVKHLEREAKATAERLGHTWSGLAVVYVKTADGETTRKEHWARCYRCKQTAIITARDFHRPPIRGEMVAFACPNPSTTARTCTYCGKPVDIWKQTLCTAPTRMGPCE